MIATDYLNLIEMLKPLVVAGIRVELVVDKDKDYFGFGFKVDGFYKSGQVSIFCEELESLDDNVSYSVESRYGQVDVIETFKDLVSINYQWWLKSKDRFDGWSTPDANWLPFLVREGFVKETDCVNTKG